MSYDALATHASGYVGIPTTAVGDLPKIVEFLDKCRRLRLSDVHIPGLLSAQWPAQVASETKTKRPKAKPAAEPVVQPDALTKRQLELEQLMARANNVNADVEKAYGVPANILSTLLSSAD